MPTTIGPFTNVPQPTDPLKSDWAQQLTQFAVDQISSGPTAPTNPDAELWYDTSDLGASFPNMPRGHIASALQTGAQSGIAVAEVDLTGYTITWEADPTRRYLIIVQCLLRQTGGPGEQYIQITNAANTHIKGWGQSVVANGVNGVYLTLPESALSGSQTRKVRASTNAGTMGLGAAEYAGYISLWDIGGV